MRTDLRQAAARSLVRPRAVAPVSDLAPLRHPGAAAIGIAAKDAAQCRRTGIATRSGTGSVEDRKTLAGTVDERTGRLARLPENAQGRGSALCHPASAIAALVTSTFE